MTKYTDEKDRGWNKIKKMLSRNVNGKAASVGWQGSEAGQDHDGTTNVELAAVHEFGSKDGKIPERKLMRATLEQHAEKYSKEEAEILKKALEGKDIDGLLLLLGEMFKADMFETVNGHKLRQIADWADSTKARKEQQGKSGDPILRDTGQLMDAIGVEVVDPKSKK